MPAISASPTDAAADAEPDPTGEIAAATADLDDDVPAGTTSVVPERRR